MANPAPTQWERIAETQKPTGDEVAAMLRDLHDFAGTWRNVVQLIGAPLNTIRAWSYGRNHPSSLSARAVWLTWCMVIRPGEIKTVWDLITTGRGTKRGDPATAGAGRKKHAPRETAASGVWQV